MGIIRPSERNELEETLEALAFGYVIKTLEEVVTEGKIKPLAELAWIFASGLFR